MTIASVLTRAFTDAGIDHPEQVAAVAVNALDPWPAGWFCDIDHNVGAPPWQWERCDSHICTDMPLWVLRKVEGL